MVAQVMLRGVCEGVRMSGGPLTDVKIVEFAGVGPSPFGAMLLADLGATVLRIERTSPDNLGVKRPRKYNYNLRSRSIVNLDLKSAEDCEIARSLVKDGDVLIEGYRPGVMERLSLGPDVCLADNPKLIYARMTGWGQTGPNAGLAGHDLNYIAVSGALSLIGRKGDLPAPPLNILGDFAGGGMTLVIGILSALHEMRKSGHGQVVDASVVDGTLALTAQFFGMYDAGIWGLERGTNFLDSGAPYYDTYQCKDQKIIALAAIEDKFFAQFIDRAGLPEVLLEWKSDRETWPRLRDSIKARFAEKARDEWVEIFAGMDVCVSPVLDLDEARADCHLVERNAFVEVGGQWQPAPTPRFSRSATSMPKAPSSSRVFNKQDVTKWWHELS